MFIRHLPTVGFKRFRRTWASSTAYSSGRDRPGNRCVKFVHSGCFMTVWRCVHLGCVHSGCVAVRVFLQNVAFCLCAFWPFAFWPCAFWLCALWLFCVAMCASWLCASMLYALIPYLFYSTTVTSGGEHVIQGRSYVPSHRIGSSLRSLHVLQR